MAEEVKDLSQARVYDVDVDEVLRYELEHADERGHDAPGPGGDQVSLSIDDFVAEARRVIAARSLTL